MYISKFRTRLTPVNLLHLKRLVAFLDALKRYVLEWKEQTLKANKTRAEVMNVADLVSRLGAKVSNVNLLEVAGYLKTSKVSLLPFAYVLGPHASQVARKIANYSDKQAEKDLGHSVYLRRSSPYLPRSRSKGEVWAVAKRRSSAAPRRRGVHALVDRYKRR